MHIVLSAFDDIPDPRAEKARHDLGERLVIAFVSVLCGATSCAEMSAFGRAKESIFRDFLKLKHAIPSHDTVSTVFRMIDPKALDAAFGQVLADVTALAHARAMSSPPVARRCAALATRARARGRGWWCRPTRPGCVSRSPVRPPTKARS